MTTLDDVLGFEKTLILVDGRAFQPTDMPGIFERLNDSEHDQSEVYADMDAIRDIAYATLNSDNTQFMRSAFTYMHDFQNQLHKKRSFMVNQLGSSAKAPQSILEYKGFMESIRDQIKPQVIETTYNLVGTDDIGSEEFYDNDTAQREVDNVLDVLTAITAAESRLVILSNSRPLRNILDHVQFKLGTSNEYWERHFERTHLQVYSTQKGAVTLEYDSHLHPRIRQLDPSI